MCVNGAAAHLADPDDIIIIANFIDIEETAISSHKPALIFVDEQNQIKELRDEIPGPAKVTANKEAKKIVIQTIQRMCAEYTIENTVSVFQLDSDDMKGQIIGREGRNIRALEAATGAEIVVDDTPEAIVISSFDPIRREVARLALKKLVADGFDHFN